MPRAKKPTQESSAARSDSPPATVAAIDIGSSSVLMRIVQTSGKGEPEVLCT